MIGYLKGTPKYSDIGLLIVTSDGVGYEVLVTQTTASSLVTEPTAELYVHTHVKEDALELFGFRSVEERALFKQLIGISGVGPRTGLGLIELSPSRVISAVQNADVGILSSVPRVGKKLAQKIIIELKSKLGSLQELNLGPKSGKEQDVYDALLALGFSENVVTKAFTQLDFTSDLDTPELIKQALKLLKEKA
jgi:holliday junction DNA helicase RuvA